MTLELTQDHKTVANELANLKNTNKSLQVKLGQLQEAATTRTARRMRQMGGPEGAGGEALDPADFMGDLQSLDNLIQQQPEKVAELIEGYERRMQYLRARLEG